MIQLFVYSFDYVLENHALLKSVKFAFMLETRFPERQKVKTQFLYRNDYSMTFLKRKKKT